MSEQPSYVIEGDPGFYLSPGPAYAWCEVRITNAWVHSGNMIETIRGEFRHHKKKPPQRMYEATRDAGKTTLATGKAIPFNFAPASASTTNENFIGDCVQLNA